MKKYIVFLGKRFMELLTKISPTFSCKILFLIRTRKWPNLKNPKTFNEKTTWLKLNDYNKNELVAKCADKYNVREYIEKNGFSDILNELYGVYDNFDDIDFNKLPNKFVIKCTHGCAYNIICSNKKTFNVDDARKKINKWMKEKYGDATTELHYLKIKPKIIIEKYLCDKNGRMPLDYKFYCINGAVKCVLVCSEREEKLRLSYYDSNWNRLNYEKKEWSSKKNIERPKRLNEMIEIAKKVSKDFPFVRVDLYCNNEKIIFGELTFTPACCCAPYYNDYGDKKLGGMLSIKRGKDNMKTKCKVLNVVSNLSQTNGVSSYVMNYYSNFSNNIDMDFLVLMDLNKEYYSKIKKNNIYEIFYNKKKNIFEYIKRMDNFFKEHSDYDIVHCQVANLGLFPLYFAKKHKIKVRIIHSHATSSADNFLKKIRNNLILIFVKKLATHYFACSKAAGKSMFGNKEFKVIENAISFDDFKYNEDKRLKIRKELKIDNKYVVGHIGRLSEQKNQRLLIKVFAEMLKKEKNVVLLLIGSGPYEERLKKQVRELEIEKEVLFLGRRSDVKDLYQAMDCFVLTSFFEGLPVTGIEAQVAGLPCVFSDTITDEVKISEKTKFVSLSASLEEWADTILKNISTDRNQKMLDKAYNIKYATDNLEKIYFSLICND